MVCYEGKFAYSNHETDPASKQLCNAFDLCRIHLYGVQDEGTKITDSTRLPSYLKMQDFVAKDKLWNRHGKKHQLSRVFRSDHLPFSIRVR